METTCIFYFPISVVVTDYTVCDSGVWFADRYLRTYEGAGRVEVWMDSTRVGLVDGLWEEPLEEVNRVSIAA